MDICNLLPKKVTEVKGLASDSASPTDTWVLQLKPGVTYNKTSVTSAFAKIFVSPKSLKAYLSIVGARLKDYDQLLLSLEALNYEIKVYEEIRAQILEPRVSPSFVLLYGHGTDCALNNVVDILNNNSPHIPFENFVRNIMYTLESKPGRPSVNKGPGLPYNKAFGNLQYNIMMNESSKGDEKFSDWFKGRSDTKELWRVIFQVAIACYAMFCARLAHNDLHSGNIFIKDLGKEEMFLYRINGVDWVIKSRYLPKLYDFDRSYKKGYINKLNEGYFCDVASNCNAIVEQRDFIKIMCYVCNNLNATTTNKIISAIAPTLKGQQVLNDTYNIEDRGYKGCFLQTLQRGKLVSLPDREYHNFNSLPIIIQNIHSYTNDRFTVDEIKRNLNVNNIYCCNFSYFDSNGKLNKVRNKKEIESLIAIVKDKAKSPVRKSPTRIVVHRSPTRRYISPRRRSPSPMSIETPKAVSRSRRRRNPSPMSIEQPKAVSRSRKRSARRRSARRRSAALRRSPAKSKTNECVIS